ncbi:hypothetical protein [Deinococcus malanensis]|nr:hypothetical protein [Deinococcus malanensis]
MTSGLRPAAQDHSTATCTTADIHVAPEERLHQTAATLNTPLDQHDQRAVRKLLAPHAWRLDPVNAEALMTVLCFVGFVLLSVLLAEFFVPWLGAYRVLVSVIVHTLLIVVCAWRTVELWRVQEHRAALKGVTLIIMWGGLLFLDVRPALAP